MYGRRVRPMYNNDNRFIGSGFLGPFILGGITGGLISPIFQRPYGPVPIPVPVPIPSPGPGPGPYPPPPPPYGPYYY